MRTLATFAATTLLLIFLAAAPAYSQDDTKPEAKAGQQQDEKNKDKDKDKGNKDKAARPDEPKTQNEGPKQNENRQPAASRPQEQRPAQEMGRGHQHHQAQRRIPDDKFRSSFGRRHTFHVQRAQVVSVSQPVVVYGGYSFELVEAWPVDWGFDDDVYIDYVDDGYYLFDLMHPGIHIAVFVVE